MLLNLQIENIAVIKKAVIDLGNGFNVMTGETGAGKSIVIDSLNAILGERTSRELIRNDADSAFVCAEFCDIGENAKLILKDFDIEYQEGDSLIIQRKIFADGKNNCRINGMPASVSMIKTIGKELVNIHGQLDNQSLLLPETHCGFIDSLAENNELLEDYQQSYRLYKNKLKELHSLHIDEEEKNRRLEILSYQIEEIESAEIHPGEKTEIENKLNLLRNSEKIMELLNYSYEILNGDENSQGIASLALKASAKLNSAAAFSDDFSEISNGVSDAAYNLSAFTDELRDKIYSIDFNASELQKLEERLDVIYRLEQKYGETEENILSFLNDAKNKYEKIEYSDEEIKKLSDECENLKNETVNKAEILSKNRQKTSLAFSNNVTEELRFLDMPSVKFTVANNRGDLCENGIDNIEFLLSANAGEKEKPLSKIASGGELSRIMLAIKSVLANKDSVDTLVFDEIDSGVSGRAALKIAQKLSDLSKSHQVICVTHLAQLAAYADEHLLIEKNESGGKTFTELRSLDYTGRKFELARIMGGLTVTENILNSADELLKGAGIKNKG